MQSLRFLLFIVCVKIATSAPFNKDDDLNDFVDVLSKSGNLSVDPCEDFYEFVCGEWGNEEQIFTWIDSSFVKLAQSRANDLITELLSGKSSDEEESEASEVAFENTFKRAAKLMRKYYRQCSELKANGSVSDIDNDIDTFEYLKSFDIQQFLDPSHNITWDDLSALLGKTLGEPFIGLQPVIDDSGRSDDYIYIDTDLEIIQKGDGEIDKYGIEKLVNMFRMNGLPVHENESLRKLVDQMFELSRNISTILARATENLSFSNITNIHTLNWRTFFEAADIRIIEDAAQYTRVKANLPNIVTVFELLSTSNPRAIALMILVHLGETFNLARTEIRQKLRKRNCEYWIKNSMSASWSASFARAHTDNATQALGDQIMDDVYNAYFQLLDENEWMGKKTKEVISKRVENIERIMGYFPLSHPSLKKFISEMNYQETGSFQVVVLKSVYQRKKDQLRFILANQPDAHEIREILSTSVGAFYSFRAQRMMVTSAIMQPPFLSSTYPIAVNYGSLGLTVGHELAHSFGAYGIEGRDVILKENMKLKVSKEDTNRIEEGLDCLIDMFNNQSVNGENTHRENLADHTGLSVAIKAFESYERMNGNVQSIRVKDREFTGAQQFFLGFALFQCARPSHPSHYAKVPHAPMRPRVNVALQNKPEFAKAFNCPAQSAMNPERRCRIW